MDIEEKIELFKKPPTEEILTIEDLHNYIENGIPLKHYQGFEISGFVHLGTGLISGLKIAHLQKAGVETTIFLADWHSWINDKLGGDMETIRWVAKNYFAEAMKLSVKAMGGDPDKVNIILGSELYEENPHYWETVIDVAKHTTLSRVRRSITIMGRKMGESLDFAKLIYPVMQVADIFTLQVNIAHAGLDQRKAHVIAREVALKIRVNKLTAEIDGEEKVIKPIALHHSLLLGFQISDDDVRMIKEAESKGDSIAAKDIFIDVKMSKSKPKSAIFVHDSPEEIKDKIRSAYCPARQIEYNPIIDITRLLIFPLDGELHIDRPAKFGGPVDYTSFDELKSDFQKGALHPLDLKNGVAEWLIRKLDPINKYFSSGPGKKAFERMKEIRITR
ncbi:MAG: tyrosine--tRNA ligase [Candidatus Odinarchaeota archaeon]|nr:tyrosine--tRNA ligase [Candidatus Odinarchaeota archaeon]